jgi:hypothetical protein
VTPWERAAARVARDAWVPPSVIEISGKPGGTGVALVRSATGSRRQLQHQLVVLEQELGAAGLQPALIVIASASGNSPLDESPWLRRLTSIGAGKRLAWLAVTDLDRISRNGSTTGLCAEILEANDAQLLVGARRVTVEEARWSALLISKEGDRQSRRIRAGLERRTKQRSS